MEDQPTNLSLVSNLQNNFVDSNLVRPQSRSLWFSLLLYLLTVTAISLVIFFLMWTLLRNEENENALILATTVSGLFFGIALVAREIVWRRAQTHHLLRRNSAFESSFLPRKKIKPKKFTLEENEAVLKFIEKKSNEAFSIDSTPAKHFEVFSAAQKYLDFIASELTNVRPGSPRLLAFKKGQERVSKLHEHLLNWAAGETQNLTREAAAHATTREKIATAQRATNILQSALLIYPHETVLIASITAIEEFIVSTRVAHWVDLAERAIFKKQYRRAIDHYQDALFYLEREDSSATEKPEHASISRRLKNEIKRLREEIAKQKSNKN